MKDYILYTILLLTGLFGTYAVIPLFKNLLINGNVLRPNYKKDMIPVSMGIVLKVYLKEVLQQEVLKLYLVDL